MSQSLDLISLLAAILKTPLKLTSADEKTGLVLQTHSRPKALCRLAEPTADSQQPKKFHSIFLPKTKFLTNQLINLCGVRSQLQIHMSQGLFLGCNLANPPLDNHAQMLVLYTPRSSAI